MTEEQLESLIQKYADGIASDEDIQMLMHWYRTSPVNEVNWPSENADEKQQLQDRMLKRLQSALPARQARVIRFPWMRIAAALIILITGVAVSYYFIGRDNRSLVTVTNPSGKIQMVILPDSSRIWLNALSTLSYNKSFNTSRDLQLDGEAFFQVTHDPSHPFTIDAGGVKTIVLGTSFNIKAYRSDKNTKVSVITGKVKVASGSRQLAVLNPSQELRFDRTNGTSNVSISDTSNVIAWQKGELRFSGQPLSEIAATLERWYGMRITFSNPGMANCRYYMSFDNNISLYKLLGAMSAIAAMKYQVDEQNKSISLSGNECH
jgi:transmembrane sensor